MDRSEDKLSKQKKETHITCQFLTRLFCKIQFSITLRRGRTFFHNLSTKPFWVCRQLWKKKPDGGFMNLLHKTSAISFYKIQSGFVAFKSRIREVLGATSEINLDDVMNDDDLYSFYRNGESADFVAAAIGGSIAD